MANLIRRMLVAVLLLVALPLAAQEIELHTYIVVLHEGRENQTEPDFKGLGAQVTQRWKNRRAVMIPADAVEALRQHPAVHFLQHVSDQPPIPTQRPTHKLLLTDEAIEIQSGTGVIEWQSGTYSYDGAGNITAIGTDSFVYDKIGRLKSATVNGRNESYSYDVFGNRTAVTTDGLTTNSPTDTATNQLSDTTRFEYDAYGNLTRYNRTAISTPAKYYYDGLGQLILAETAIGQRKRFLYTASGERISTIASDENAHWTLRDLKGKVLREYESGPGNTWLWVSDYVYRDDRLAAMESNPELGGKRHFHLDHLGSPRLITTSTVPARRVSRHDLWPFGVEQSSSIQEIDLGFAATQPMKFTGHERDVHGFANVDGSDYLDYMHARYYDPGLGRFLTVDPLLNTRVASKRPQRWNRYMYGDNTPLNRIDPDGRDSLDPLRSLGTWVDFFVNAGGTNADGETMLSRAQEHPDEAVAVAGGVATVSLTAGGIAVAATAAESLSFVGLQQAAASAAVIGETIRRVQAAASRMNASTFRAAWDGTTAVFTQNLAWLQANIDKGARIFDIGRDAFRSPSLYYMLETALLRANGYAPRFVRFVFIDGKAVRMFEWVKVAPVSK